MNIITTTKNVTIDTKPVRTGNAKSVFCITTGKVYASGIDAAADVGCTAGSISLACRGHIHTVHGMEWCFVKDMPENILKISNAYQDIYNDAMAYRKDEVERKRKEAHKAAMKKREERMERLKAELEAEESMYEAMKKEFDF